VRIGDNDIYNSSTPFNVDYKIKNIEMNNNPIILKIIDYQNLDHMDPYEGMNVCIIVYDITNIESFNQVEKWYREAIGSWNDKMMIFLVGNKCDLENDRVVSFDEGNKLGNEYGILFFEVSARDEKKVGDMLDAMVKNLFIMDDVYNFLGNYNRSLPSIRNKR